MVQIITNLFLPMVMNFINLLSYNVNPANRIQALNEFKENRNNLYLIVKDLETELFNQEAEHRDARYILDKQHLIEKDK